MQEITILGSPPKAVYTEQQVREQINEAKKFKLLVLPQNIVRHCPNLGDTISGVDLFHRTSPRPKSTRMFVPLKSVSSKICQQRSFFESTNTFRSSDDQI
jgi:hypothetical protein